MVAIGSPPLKRWLCEGNSPTAYLSCSAGAGGSCDQAIFDPLPLPLACRQSDNTKLRRRAAFYIQVRKVQFAPSALPTLSVGGKRLDFAPRKAAL